MGVITAISLFLIAIGLVVAVQMKLISGETLGIWAKATGVVAFLAAILVFVVPAALPTPSLPEEMDTPINPTQIPITNTSSFIPTSNTNGVLIDTPIDISVYSNGNITGSFPELSLGEHHFGSVLFYIPKGNNSIHTQTSHNPQFSTDYVIPFSYIASPKKVFILINAGFTYNFNGKNIGYIELLFTNGGSLKYDLVLGENVREWSIGSAAINSDLVITTNSPEIQQVYLTTNQIDTTAVIDMLELEIPDEHSSAAIESIRFKDSSQELWDSMNPGFFVTGITVRSLK